MLSSKQENPKLNVTLMTTFHCITTRLSAIPAVWWKRWLQRWIIPIPDHLELNEMVTRAKLDRESRGELV